MLAINDPAFKPQIEREAKAKAVESLGIFEDYTRVHEIEDIIHGLNDEMKKLFDQMKLQVGESQEASHYYARQHVAKAVQNRQVLCEAELLKDSKLGQQLLKLKREKEELLDTVWLAKSPIQITNLWTRVIALFGETLTDL